jgi:hypothetical protein
MKKKIKVKDNKNQNVKPKLLELSEIRIDWIGLLNPEYKIVFYHSFYHKYLNWISNIYYLFIQIK